MYVVCACIHACVHFHTCACMHRRAHPANQPVQGLSTPLVGTPRDAVQSEKAIPAPSPPPRRPSSVVVANSLVPVSPCLPSTTGNIGALSDGGTEASRTSQNLQGTTWGGAGVVRAPRPRLAAAVSRTEEEEPGSPERFSPREELGFQISSGVPLETTKISPDAYPGKNGDVLWCSPCEGPGPSLVPFQKGLGPPLLLPSQAQECVTLGCGGCWLPVAHHRLPGQLFLPSWAEP